MKYLKAVFKTVSMVLFLVAFSIICFGLPKNARAEETDPVVTDQTIPDQTMTNPTTAEPINTDPATTEPTVTDPSVNDNTDQPPVIQLTDEESAISILQENLAVFGARTVKFQYGSSHSFFPTLTRLGISYDVTQTLANLYLACGEENILTCTQNLLALDQIPYSITVNDANFNAYVSVIGKSTLRQPKNYSLKVVWGRVYTIMGHVGYIFTTEPLKTNLVTDLTNHQSQIYQLQIDTVNPKIGLAEIENAKIHARAMISQSISVRSCYNHSQRLTRGNKTYYASRAMIGSWIVFQVGDTELVAILSKNRIKTWLKAVYKITYVSPRRRLLAYDLYRHKVKLRSGLSGQRLPYLLAVDPLYNALTIETRFHLHLSTVKVRPGDKIIGGIIPGRYRGKFIEISLSQQRMYVFHGRHLLHIYLISSGRPGMDTPSGRFHIRDKRPWNACNPSSEYSSCWMPLTMHFTSRGHAIHALPIINGRQEGAWHLGYKVSHGCVRVGPSQARWLYRWTRIGTPVMIHH